MVYDALAYLGLASLGAWLLGTIWVSLGGRLALPIYAGALFSLCGVALVLVAVAAPRGSAFWLPQVGGDGEGLIGDMIIGAGAVLVGLVLMLISGAAAAGRAFIQSRWKRAKGAE